jgi:hypothetical protein
VGDPAFVISWFPLVVVLQICFLLVLLVGESFLFFFHIFALFDGGVLCVISFLNIEKFSSSELSRLPASLLVQVTIFGCWLSFSVFCAKSLTLLLISLVVFSVIIFRLMAFFVEFRVGTVF